MGAGASIEATESMVVSASRDRTVRLWDVATGSCTRTFRGHTHHVHSAGFAPSGLAIASCSRDRKVFIWQLGGGKGRERCDSGVEVLALAVAPLDGRIAAARKDHRVTVWSADGDTLLHTLNGHSAEVGAVAFSPDGLRLASGANDNVVRVWDVDTGTLQVSIHNLTGWVTALGWSNDGKVIGVGAKNAGAALYYASDGVLQSTVSQTYVAGLTFCRTGGRLLAVGEGRTVRVWDLNLDVTVATLGSAHGPEVTCLAFNFGGTLLVTGSTDSVLRVFSVTEGECVREIKGHADRVTTVAFFDYRATDDDGTDGVATTETVGTLADEPTAAHSGNGSSNFKVLVVGNPGVGKTSFIRQCAEGYFMDKYKATIGVDFSTVDVGGSDGTIEATLALWDIAGQERFGAMNRIYFKGAYGAFVMVDASDSVALETARLWKKELDEKVTAPNGDNVPTVLLANKCDLPHVLTDASLDRFCEEHGFSAWLFTSAKEGTNVEECNALILDRIKAADAGRAPATQGIQLGGAVEEPTPCCA